MKKTSLKTNALLNGVRQCCSLLFPLITFPYVSRVLGSEAYGKYNFGFSYVSYFVLLAALGTAAYAVREGSGLRDDSEKLSRFADELFSINIVTMLFAYAALLLSFVFWRKLDTYRTLILVQSMSVFLNSIGVDWINSIFEDFRYITIRYIAFQGAAVLLMFALVRSPEDYIIYAAIHTFANSGANLMNLFYTRKRYIKTRFTVSMGFRRHIAPLLVLFCNTLAVTIYVNSDITLIGIFRTDTEVGMYSVAAKIYNILKQVLNAVIVVVIPRVAYYLGNKNQEKYQHLLNMTLRTLLCLTLPVIAGIFVLAEEIVFLAGGGEYFPAVTPLRILCGALGFSVLACFFSNAVLIVHKMEAAALKATAASAAVNIALNLYFIPRYGITGAAVTTAAAEFCVFLVSMKASGNKWKKDFGGKEIFSYILGSMAAGGAAFLIKLTAAPVPAKVFFSVFAAGAVYFGILLSLKNEIALAGVSSLRTFAAHKRELHKKDQKK